MSSALRTCHSSTKSHWFITLRCFGCAVARTWPLELDSNPCSLGPCGAASDDARSYAFAIWNVELLHDDIPQRVALGKHLAQGMELWRVQHKNDIFALGLFTVIPDHRQCQTIRFRNEGCRWYASVVSDQNGACNQQVEFVIIARLFLLQLGNAEALKRWPTFCCERTTSS